MSAQHMPFESLSQLLETIYSYEYISMQRLLLQLKDHAQSQYIIFFILSPSLSLSLSLALSLSIFPSHMNSSTYHSSPKTVTACHIRNLNEMWKDALASVEEFSSIDL